MATFVDRASGVSVLKRDLVEAWSEETSAQPAQWTPDNPALGQCAVTALVVQEMLGGELRRAMVSGISHYWNRLESGEEIDLTIDQFDGDARLESDVVVRTREYVLSFPDTAERYELLRRRLNRD